MQTWPFIETGSCEKEECARTITICNTKHYISILDGESGTVTIRYKVGNGRFVTCYCTSNVGRIVGSKNVLVGVFILTFGFLRHPGLFI